MADETANELPFTPYEAARKAIDTLRDKETGGFIDTPTFDGLLRLYEGLTAYEKVPQPGRYWFSSIGNCFLKAWAKSKNNEAVFKAKQEGKTLVNLPFPTDPGHEDFPTGSAESGNAVEERILHIARRVLGQEGTVLKHIRFSIVVPYDDKENFTFVGRSDPLIIGDNFQPLDFFEVKSQKFAPKKFKDFSAKIGKEAPLAVAGVESKDNPDGLASLNNLLQLAIGIKALRGLNPKKKRLLYVWAGSFEDHVSILLSDKDVDLLYSIAEWWTYEHHKNLKSDEPPLPRFFMGYECGYCPIAGTCATIRKLRGWGKQEVHPIMLTVNDRIRKANGMSNLAPKEAPVNAPTPTQAPSQPDKPGGVGTGGNAGPGAAVDPKPAAVPARRPRAGRKSGPEGGAAPQPVPGNLPGGGTAAGPRTGPVVPPRLPGSRVPGVEVPGPAESGRGAGGAGGGRP